jgi:Asp-tRNA(Asn)/Glu-tRNA(Gln) amidotransferase A subunit family amidase
MQPSSAARPLSGLTVALTDRPEAVGVDAEVAKLLEAATIAAERLGARIVRLPAIPDLSGHDFSVILLSEVAAYHPQQIAGADGAYRPSVREFIDQSRSFTSVEAYLNAQRRRTRVTAAWEEWFSEHGVDVILEPTTPCAAPERGHGYESGHPAGQGDPLVVLTATWDVTGFPVASLPGGLGERSKLPVGLSVIGPRGADARTLQIGIDMQAHALPPLEIAKPQSSSRGDRAERAT